MTLDNQKITFDFLKSHLWSAADILRGSLDPSEYRQPVMTLLFLKRLNDTFEEKIKKYGKIIGNEPNRIEIKDHNKRWGSLDQNRTINLNVNLLKAPEDVIDYLIIHELYHLKINGHTYRFWNYLKQFVPDYEQKIKWLERNSTNIL